MQEDGQYLAAPTVLDGILKLLTSKNLSKAYEAICVGLLGNAMHSTILHRPYIGFFSDLQIIKLGGDTLPKNCC